MSRTFNRFFGVVCRRNDQPTTANPFYFLSGDGFWRIERPGQGPFYEPGNASSQGRGQKGGKWITGMGSAGARLVYCYAVLGLRSWEGCLGAWICSGGNR
jgi:hypothetical protein